MTFDQLTELEAEVARQRAEWEIRVARYPLYQRAVADQRDRAGWAKARSRGIGASDAMNYARLESVPQYVKSKLYSPFDGNSFTSHGNRREPAMLAAYNLQQNTIMFHAEGNPRHLATPDGILFGGDGEIVLAQCKTSTKPLPATIPANYRRQMWWEMYVIGARRSLLIWEQHDGTFQPVEMEPESRWLYWDDPKNDIANTLVIADAVLARLDMADEFEREMEASL